MNGRGHFVRHPARRGMPRYALPTDPLRREPAQLELQAHTASRRGHAPNKLKSKRTHTRSRVILTFSTLDAENDTLRLGLLVWVLKVNFGTGATISILCAATPSTSRTSMVGEWTMMLPRPPTRRTSSWRSRGLREIRAPKSK